MFLVVQMDFPWRVNQGSYTGGLFFILIVALDIYSQRRKYGHFNCCMHLKSKESLLHCEAAGDLWTLLSLNFS